MSCLALLVEAQGPGTVGGGSPDVPSSPSTSVSGPAPLEPPTGKRLFGAALNLKSDSPTEFNTRIGQSASVFMFSMHIPPLNVSNNTPSPAPGAVGFGAGTDNLELIDETATDAYVHLSVFPRRGLDSQNFTQADIQRIVNTCAGFNARGRGVFLRFAPSMNTPWVRWGQQPSLFTVAWNNLHKALREHPEANQTALVWAPQEATGSPWPKGGSSSPAPGTANYDAINPKDPFQDPYAVYWPGDIYVDWVGLSVYYRGKQYPWTANGLPTVDAIADAIRGVNSVSKTDFYDRYAAQKGKPFMLAETAAVYLRNKTGSQAIPAGDPAEVATKRAWWSQYMAPTFTNSFPLLKMICLWDMQEEGEQAQSNLYLDYRVTNRTVNEFAADLKASQGSFIWGNATGFRTTYVPADAFKNPTLPPGPPSGPGPDDGNGSDNGGAASRLPQAAILAMFIVPFTSVGCWFAFAIFRFRRARRAAAAAALEAENAPPSPDNGSEKGDEGEDAAEVESVDDSATIVNVNATLDRSKHRSLDEVSLGQQSSHLSVDGHSSNSSNSSATGSLPRRSSSQIDRLDQIDIAIHPSTTSI
ncbi:hypothetical protein PhCBS80983_g03719 [Powellomyces hirtus]|uniref:GH26 domain-containing protein n=1 Tax=Powellomyces hirtus TaxID=109895 RepID=A0A507E2M3_9FUNG|nr:hypothetical protein PhCBS80983_g03719 [Powellomyces hirtus]